MSYDKKLHNFYTFRTFIVRNKLQAIPTPSETEASISHRIAKKLSDIYYGRLEHPWAMEIENWDAETSFSNLKKPIFDDARKQQFQY